MSIHFSTDEMVHYLQARHYQIAKAPAKYINRSGPAEEEQETKIDVAFKPAQWPTLKELYWLEDIEGQFGLKNVFQAEMKKTLLRLA